jgi:hypothetical protein
LRARSRMLGTEHLNAAAARRAEAPLATSVFSRSSSSELQGALIRLMIRFVRLIELELTGHGSVPRGRAGAVTGEKMAVNKPVGDNARKGAVKKRYQARWRHRPDKAQQDIRGVYGG